MPRKRTFTASQKSKPKLPAKDIGQSLTKQERGDKLQVILQDYDLKVAEMKAGLEKQCAEMLRTVEQKFNYELANIPVAVRKMTLEEFINCGGTVATAQEYLMAKENVDIDPVLSSSKAYANRLKDFQFSQHFDTISEDSTGGTNAFVMPKASVKRGNRHGLNTPLPTTGSKFFTPATGRSLKATGWATPMVTPKFDPRLPLTNAQKRPARKGEISMSLQGSPLQTGVVKTRGKTFMVDMETNDIEIPDNLTTDQITTIMRTLQQFMDKAND